MDTIINPVDGIKYSLHSTRGRELLKLYINNYKLGGSATLVGSPWIFDNVKQFLNNAVDSVKGIFKRQDDTLETSMRNADASRFTMNPIFKAPETVIPDKRSSAARKIQRNWLKTNSPEITVGPSPKHIDDVWKFNRQRAVRLTGLERLGHRLDDTEILFLEQQEDIREQRNESPEDFEREVKEFMIDYSESSDPMRDTMASLDSSSEEDLMRDTTAFYSSSSSDEILPHDVPRALRNSYGSLSSSYT